jgi:stage II sporulation protein D
MGNTTSVVVATSALALALGLSPGASARMHFVPATRQVELTGHGYGHGIGLSQYGAERAAREGNTYRTILRFYYPGTTIGTARGRIRVLITADTTSDVKVSPRAGLAVRDGDGTRTLPTNLGATRWRLTPGPNRVEYTAGSGWRRWRYIGSSPEFVAPGPIRLWVPSGGSEVARSYRGALRMATPPGSSSRDTVNVLPLEEYLRGVVAREMPASWSPAALKAQAVAARTYAVRTRAQYQSRYYQICDTTSCQVYGGVGAEHPDTDAAISAVDGETLYYGGTAALTMFSASNGGYSVDGGRPYLVARRDPWDAWSGNPVHTWTRTLTASSIQSEFPSIGTLIGIDVVERDGNGQWGGRIERAVLDGTSGNVTVTGADLRWRFGLRSTWLVPRSTAIDKRWSALGRSASPVGGTQAGEAFVAGGARQVFRSGRIFWSDDTGAREVYGAILRRYSRLGQHASVLGFPTTGELAGAVPGSRLNRFQRGRIYWSSGTGAHEVHGRILRRYLGLGGETSRLRLPTSGEYDVPGGRRSDFQGGRLTWNRTTGAVTVQYY